MIPSHPSTELPTGIITFLFTDIVGSTRIWEDEPALMAHALHRLDEIMTEAVGRHRGVLIKIRGEGDSTFSVFQIASDAVAAAIDAQTRVSDEGWLTSKPIEMRIAIHSGEAEERGGDYFGRTVNRAARLRSLAGPGDIYVSQRTSELASGGLPHGASLVPLGPRRLRDIERPEHVYRVEWPAGRPIPRRSEPDVDADRTDQIALPNSVARAAGARFVGRSASVGLLTRAIDQATAGERQIVLVSGEPGMGKTALCSRVASAAHRSGATVLAGRCERDLAVPYRPFVEAMSRSIDAMSDRELAELDTWALTALAAVIPQVRSRRAIDERQSDLDDSDRYVLMQAVVDLLTRLTRTRPVVVLLEDLHWADAETLRLLRHIAMSDGPAHLTIIGNYRSDELTPDMPLSTLVADLAREPNLVAIELAGLEVDDIATLAKGRVIRSGDASEAAERHLATALHGTTGGNPFFVGEILRHLGDSPDHRDAVDVSNLPRSLNTVVRQRVERCGEAAHRVLGIAAVCGLQFSARVVSRLAGEPDDLVLDIIEDVQRVALVREASALGEFRFVHGLVQQVLYQELSNTRRCRLHRTVAELLETERGDDYDVAEEIASHWERSDRPPDHPDVIRAIRRAGDAALAQRAPQRALTRFTQLAERLGPTVDPSDRADALIGLGESQRRLGLAAFRDTLVEAAALAGAAGDAERLTAAVFAMNRGMVASAGVVDEHKIAAIDRALHLIGDDDTPDRARLLAMKGAELLYAQDFPLRRRLSDEANAIARRTGDPSALLDVLNERFLTITAPETARERRLEADEAESIAIEIGDLRGEYFAALGGSLAALECGDGAGYARRLARMAAIADELQRPVLRWIHLWNDSVRLLNEGHLDEAQRIADQSVSLGVELEQPDAFVNYAGILGGILVHRGLLHTIADQIGENAVRYPAIASYRVAHAVALADRGDSDVALELVEDFVKANFAPLDDDIFATVSFALLADLASRLDHRSAAEALIHRMTPFRGLVACAPTSCQGAYAHWLGELHRVIGMPEAAAELLAEAATTHEALGFPYFIAKTSLARGLLLDDHSLIESAAQIAKRHGYDAVTAAAVSALGNRV